jgi:hypothetical protein
MPEQAMTREHSQAGQLLAVQKLAAEILELAENYPVGHVNPKSRGLGLQIDAARKMTERTVQIQKQAAILLEIAAQGPTV